MQLNGCSLAMVQPRGRHVSNTYSIRRLHQQNSLQLPSTAACLKETMSVGKVRVFVPIDSFTKNFDSDIKRRGPVLPCSSISGRLFIQITAEVSSYRRFPAAPAVERLNYPETSTCRLPRHSNKAPNTPIPT